ncbi:MAG: hypothetical protein ACK559_22390, partial [bacterium]
RFLHLTHEVWTQKAHPALTQYRIKWADSRVKMALDTKSENAHELRLEIIREFLCLLSFAFYEI